MSLDTAARVFGEKHVEKKNNSKTVSALNSQIAQSEAYLKNYLESQGKTFCPVPGGYAVIKRTVVKPAYNEELIGACFQEFLRIKSVSCGPEVVHSFLAFIEEQRDKNKTSVSSLVFQTQKPVAEFFANVQ